jgi:hypothetical protein
MISCGFPDNTSRSCSGRTSCVPPSRANVVTMRLTRRTIASRCPMWCARCPMDCQAVDRRRRNQTRPPGKVELPGGSFRLEIGREVKQAPSTGAGRSTFSDLAGCHQIHLDRKGTFVDQQSANCTYIPGQPLRCRSLVPPLPPFRPSGFAKADRSRPRRPAARQTELALSGL